MPYITGTVNSLAELLTALRNNCVANGWTLAGEVLHKGGCYVRARLETAMSGAPVDGLLAIRAGNGIDASNNLLDTAAYDANLGFIKATATSSSFELWDFPVTYHLHIHSAPDEVYLFVNYLGAQYWQWLAFGKSPAPGNQGTGNWQAATIPKFPLASIESQYIWQRDGASIAHNGGQGMRGPYKFVPMPFWVDDTRSRPVASAIHGAVDPVTDAPVWSGQEGGFTHSDAPELTLQVSAARSIEPLLLYARNSWNEETILLPMIVIQQRAEQKTSIVGRMEHLRFCRNDNVDPGGLITLGADRWKTYPAYRKNIDMRDGGVDIDHSGTFAMAIRYDGP